jgi:hypothetical protein
MTEKKLKPYRQAFLGVQLHHRNVIKFNRIEDKPMAQKTKNLLKKKSFLKQERIISPLSENDKYAIGPIVNYRKQEQTGTIQHENIQRIARGSLRSQYI